MNTKTKNIIIISSIVAVGVGGYFLVNYLLKPKLTDGEKKLIEEMSKANKGDGGESSSGSGSNTNNSNNSGDKNPISIPTDAKIILSKLSGWTTDSDENFIVTILSKYDKKTFKDLESFFNVEYKYKQTPLRKWLDTDLSDDNFNKIKRVL